MSVKISSIHVNISYQGPPDSASVLSIDFSSDAIVFTVDFTAGNSEGHRIEDTVVSRTSFRVSIVPRLLNHAVYF